MSDIIISTPIKDRANIIPTDENNAETLSLKDSRVYLFKVKNSLPLLSLYAETIPAIMINIIKNKYTVSVIFISA